MHRAGALVGRIHGRANPFEVADHVSSNSGMDIRCLRNEGGPCSSSDDGLSQILGRCCAQCLVHIRKVLAIEFVKIAIVGGVVLRPIPPVPIAALRNQDFLKSQLALRFTDLWRSLGVEVTCIAEVIPGSIVLRSSDPNIEIGMNPGAGRQRT